MRSLLALSLLTLGGLSILPQPAPAEEPILQPPRKQLEAQALHNRWSPAATDICGLLWNDCAPAFYPGVYAPGWGGWWYMYYGHTYSPCFSPHLHDYPRHYYTHPYFSYPLDPPWAVEVAEARKPAPAKVVVSLPADAKLTVNGQATELTSDQRVFTTPDLKPGKDYYYVINAEVVRDGEVKSVTKEVAVSAGKESRVEFALPGAATVRR